MARSLTAKRDQRTAILYQSITALANFKKNTESYNRQLALIRQDIQFLVEAAVEEGIEAGNAEFADTEEKLRKEVASLRNTVARHTTNY